MALAALVAAVVLLGGCSTYGALDEMAGRLRDEGYRDVRVTVDQRSFRNLVVEADPPRGTSARAGEVEVAELVWDTFPRRFDVLRTKVDGRDRRWADDELAERFGPRPARLDRRHLEDDGNRLVVVTVMGLLAGVVVLVLLIGVVLLLVTRSRRRTLDAPTRPWMPPGHGASPSGGAPFPPPGGWGTALPTPPPVPPGAAPTPPTPPGTAPTTPPPTGSATPGPTPTPGPSTPPRPSTPGDGPRWPPLPPSPRRLRDEARRFGRPAPGPRPDAAHTPPGWG